MNHSAAIIRSLVIYGVCLPLAICLPLEATSLKKVRSVAELNKSSL